MPRLVIIGGPNGAGKSTMGPELLRGPLGVEAFVNADVIASGLSGLAPERAAFEAGRLMLARIRELAAGGADFAFESKLASRSFAPWISGLKKAGYRFHLVFLHLETAQLAVTRVARRVASGGHGAPESDVKRRYQRGLTNFFTLCRPIADSWLLLDNSAEGSPMAIAWRNEGSQVEWVKNGPWESIRHDYER